MDLSRTLVIGNSGSGKSWLAERIAGQIDAACVDLDLIHWQPGGYNIARARDEAIELVRAEANQDRWVIEGIYGWLVSEIQSQATALVWLCIEPAECAANIRRRGIRRGGTEEAFAALLQWAETYLSREGSSAYAAHARLFHDFAGAKTCLRSREDVTRFANSLAS
ncbi:adenylate kinase [uncultured Ralstonia sp.]|jgi:adenylate kinase family enzyme|uniref:adenylate kinase n=1 Tax=Ralstonia sp. TaxID=54061 RepID=UPI001EA7CAC1|nr:adenylate kinase [uncultured Ralstonia sp.]UCF23179.1 MAG: adenylate kinase [Ralstonia sp.]